MKMGFATLAMAALAVSAQAELREFRFTGTVTYGVPMAPVGSKVSGTFSYDDTLPPAYVLGDPSGQGSRNAAYLVPRRMTLEVNGHTMTSDALRVDIVDNFGGNIEDSFSVDGAPMTLDGTFFSEGTFGIALASGPGRTQVLRTIDLPKRIVVKKFDGMNGGFVQVNGGPDGLLLQFTIDSVDRVRGKSDRDDD